MLFLNLKIQIQDILGVFLSFIILVQNLVFETAYILVETYFIDGLF